MTRVDPKTLVQPLQYITNNFKGSLSILWVASFFAISKDDTTKCKDVEATSSKRQNVIFFNTPKEASCAHVDIGDGVPQHHLRCLFTFC